MMHQKMKLLHLLKNSRKKIFKNINKKKLRIWWKYKKMLKFCKEKKDRFCRHASR